MCGSELRWTDLFATCFVINLLMCVTQWSSWNNKLCSSINQVDPWEVLLLSVVCAEVMPSIARVLQLVVVVVPVNDSLVTDSLVKLYHKCVYAIWWSYCVVSSWESRLVDWWSWRHSYCHV